MSDDTVRELIQQLKADNEALKQQLQADREANVAALTRLNDTLIRAFAVGQGPSVPNITPGPAPPNIVTIPHSIGTPVLSPLRGSRRTTGSFSLTADERNGPPRSVFSGITGLTGDSDTDSGDDESFFVQQYLPTDSHAEEGLRLYLKQHEFDEYGGMILGPIRHDKGFLDRSNLFTDDESTSKRNEDHVHGVVYDVGTDGAALLSRTDSKSLSQAMFQSLSQTNVDPSKRQAVGRIAIVREPSALLFGVCHYTLRSHFDMDGLYRLLSNESATKAYMRSGFKRDARRQRTFVFAIKAFTIVAENRKPFLWQKSDKDLTSSPTHIPITTCSSVIALSLSGAHIKSVKSKTRRAITKVGHVYDPFAPWRVLNIQCYPDWKSTVDDHEANRHYVNGPDAFLVTLLTEYRDATKRFMDINKRIVTLVTPPPEFMFDRNTRDLLLFEDETYTYSRRYFWAFQTLATMNDSIEALIHAYRETFTDDVWNGKDKMLWPGQKDQSSRFNNWRRKMGNLRKEFEVEIGQLEKVLEMNIREQKDIKSLRDQLFSGTSVLESRKSVEQTRITVQQGHNVKLLTLVNLVFLPLTFCTSIFGMSTIDQDSGFEAFGIVVCVICIPTYLMIASLNTHKGLKWWKARFRDVYHGFLHVCAFLYMKLIRNQQRAEELKSKITKGMEDEDDPIYGPVFRSQTAQKAIAARKDVLIVKTPQPPRPRPALKDRRKRRSSIKFQDLGTSDQQPTSLRTAPGSSDELNESAPGALGRSMTADFTSSSVQHKKSFITRALSDRWENRHKRGSPV